MNTVDDSNQIIDKKAKYFYKKLMEIKIEKQVALQRWNVILKKEVEHAYSGYVLTRVKQIKDHKIAEFNFKFFHLLYYQQTKICTNGKFKVQITV